MIAEEVVRDLFMERQFDNADDLMKALDPIASQSRTVKLRVEVLEKPVLLMMAYIRAGLEGDWRLNRATF